MLELYSADESHPSLSGSFAAACSFYSIFYKKDPGKIPFDAGLPAPDATLIRAVTKQVVFDSLSYWYRFNPLPKASLTFAITGTTVAFINTSKNSDKYTWLFGDGKMDSVKNPTYTYAKGGVYSVKLIARKCKDSDTLILPLVIQANSVNAYVNPHPVTIYPNPVENTLHLTAPDEIQSLYIYDFSGKLMYASSEIAAKEFAVDMKRFPVGTYQISLKTAKGIDHQLVTKMR